MSTTLIIFILSAGANYVPNFYTCFIIIIAGLLANFRRWGLIYYRFLPDKVYWFWYLYTIEWINDAIQLWISQVVDIDFGNLVFVSAAYKVEIWFFIILWITLWIRVWTLALILICVIDKLDASSVSSNWPLLVLINLQILRHLSLCFELSDFIR